MGGQVIRALDHMARPVIPINKNEFEKLCGLQCPLHEIADWFECSEDTIERWCKRTYKKCFAEVFELKRGRGKIALRRAQFELAKKNAAMAIFLGKNYLGQIDQVEQKTDATVESNQVIVYVPDDGRENGGN